MMPGGKDSPISISILPEEIIYTIFTLLDITSLKSARQVSKGWRVNATKSLFRTITMTPSFEGVERWQHILSNNSLCIVPARAVINTCPIPEYEPWKLNRLLPVEGEIIFAWSPYSLRDRDKIKRDLPQPYHRLVAMDSRRRNETHSRLEEQYIAFYRAFSDLTKLPALRTACLHFTPACLGGRIAHNYWEAPQGLESREFRDDILQRFFASLVARMEDPDRTDVRSLCVRNLQNVQTDITSSSDFKLVTSKVDDLSLLIVEEYNNCRSINDLYKKERCTFMPILTHDWLAPVSSHLRSLSLSFREPWGSIPGKFDPENLDFSQLRYLTLGRYCPAYSDSLDWVLKQSTLESLSLVNCQIAAYMRLKPSDIEKWLIDTTDWTLFSTDDDGRGDTDIHTLYHYPGTWAVCFENIKTRLPRLTKFLFGDSQHLEELNQVESQRLSERRYVFLDTALCPTQWIDVDSLGNMRNMFYREKPKPNRHLQTIETDEEALAILMRQLVERRYIFQS